MTPELLQAVAFVALTRPAQRPAVDAIVTSRLRASGVQLDPNDWLTLRDSATRGVDDRAGTRGFLYGLISGFSRTIVPGIFRMFVPKLGETVEEDKLGCLGSVVVSLLGTALVVGLVWLL